MAGRHQKLFDQGQGDIFERSRRDYCESGNAQKTPFAGRLVIYPVRRFGLAKFDKLCATGPLLTIHDLESLCSFPVDVFFFRRRDESQLNSICPIVSIPGVQSGICKHACTTQVWNTCAYDKSACTSTQHQPNHPHWSGCFCVVAMLSFRLQHVDLQLGLLAMSH